MYMQQESASLEIIRWGYAHLPGAILYYARELDLDMEDIGILSTLFYAFENHKPLFETGVRAGRVLQCCSTLTTNKLSRRLSRLSGMELIAVIDGDNKNFTDKIIYLEPLMGKLEQLINRDHPCFVGASVPQFADKSESNPQLEEYIKRIEMLEDQLRENEPPILPSDSPKASNQSYKRVADFISKKTGTLLSVKMENELNRWLNEMGFNPEFLLCMLELSFERNILNPRDITRIARDLKEYSINTVEGMELYFTNYVDLEKNKAQRSNPFDPDILEFGTYTGVDMNAEARKKVYNKWRYDWGFSHQMIMKAGEIMCQRTKNGGLEYIDSVLNNWMTKEIKSVGEAEKEIINYKAKNKSVRETNKPVANSSIKAKTNDYQIYVPPEVLEELKSNA